MGVYVFCAHATENIQKRLNVNAQNEMKAHISFILPETKHQPELIICVLHNKKHQ